MVKAEICPAQYGFSDTRQEQMSEEEWKSQD